VNESLDVNESLTGNESLDVNEFLDVNESLTGNESLDVNEFLDADENFISSLIDVDSEFNNETDYNFLNSLYENKSDVVNDVNNVNNVNNLNRYKIKNDAVNDCDSIDLSDLDLNDVLENQKHQKSNSNKSYFLKMKNYPVNICFMEKMKYTLDDMLRDGYIMINDEWLSVLFQITFGLAVANKNYNFVHNDLHSDNVMFQETNKQYLYFKNNKNYFKIPTFGKITKIIDFARGICKYNNNWIFSDVFHPEGEAAGQYDYPKNSKSLRGCKNKPNPSFDLVRLATTISERLEDNLEIYNLIKKWCICTDGSNVLFKDDDFDLYIDIAQNCHNAIPKDVLKDNIFTRFICDKKDIPDATHIYNL